MRLSELAAQINVEVVGDGEAEVTRCAPIDKAGPDDLAFLANSRYAAHLKTTAAAAVLIGPNVPCPERLTRLVADDPYFAFRNAMVYLHGFRQHPPPMGTDASGLSPHASIHGEARVAEDAVVHPHAVVERGAQVGRRTVLYPGVYVGTDVHIGNDCILYPNAVVYDRCQLGDRVTLHANTVVGQDGFGYATHAGAHHKIPQHGIVVIEDDVELGGGCAIERAAMGETRLGAGTKFADLISIGHGTTIGKHCLFVSLVGVSGSVTIGDSVVLGGQVGVSGHLTIGDGVQAMARTAIAQDVAPGEKVGGAPAVPYQKAKRNALAGTELYELVKRVRQLEREVENLKTSERSNG